MRADLLELKNRGRLSPAACQFAMRIVADENLLLVAALLAQVHFEQKHFCLTLDARTVDEILGTNGYPQTLDSFLPRLKASAEVGKSPADNRPLVLEEDRLYFHRCCLSEAELADRLKALRTELPIPEGISIDDPNLNPSQRAAVRTVLGNRFSVITGGPGTGKTTILHAVLKKLLAANPDLRIAACAPTGKAQARMKEAVDEQGGLDGIVFSTIHRLIGLGGSTADPKHTEANPLPFDLVAVDEVSMGDLPLILKLLRAVPAEARVVFLGDKDQLAAVEAGSVLADICSAWKTDGCVAELVGSYRFDENTSIGRLKNAVNCGDCDGVLAELGNPDASVVFENGTDLSELLKKHAYFGAYREEGLPPEEALRRFSAFRILCPVRRGPFGVERVNRMVLDLLGIEPYGQGYPVLITANDPGTGLYNGDVGLFLRTERGIRVFFPGENGTVRDFSRGQLPPHEPVFAMTVHKSQGSGFDRVLLILPDEDSPVLTKELLYTGITRTRKECIVRGLPKTIRRAVLRRCVRDSGLAGRLTAGPG